MMTKPKAKTRLELMGFVDPELSTLKHDDLVIATQTYFEHEGGCYDFEWERPMRENWGHDRVGPIVGFIDLTFISETDNHRKRIFVEVKTKINSVGELLRQLKTYRSTIFTNISWNDTNIEVWLSIPKDKLTSTQKNIIEQNDFKVLLLWK